METSGYLRVEFGRCTASAIGELLRAAAEICFQKRIARVLVVAVDADPAGERALRDALATMILAGIADRVRLALVAASPRVEFTYRNAQRDFTAAGVTTRMCESEDEAVRWLGAASSAANAGSFQSGGSPDSRGMPQRADPLGPES